MKDNGGRRRLADRRNYTSWNHFPERRGTRYRRSAWARRKYPYPPHSISLERREAYTARPEEVELSPP